MAKHKDYQKEFFDRDYTAREAYARVWQYARKYKCRLAMGVLCGMLTAGTLVPIFTVVQPALEKVSKTERMEALRAELEQAEPSETNAQPATRVATTSSHKSKLERELTAEPKLPSWYPKAKKLAAFGRLTVSKRIGVDLRATIGRLACLSTTPIAVRMLPPVGRLSVIAREGVLPSIMFVSARKSCLTIG